MQYLKILLAILQALPTLFAFFKSLEEHLSSVPKQERKASKAGLHTKLKGELAAFTSRYKRV